jgi:hypothetical protein
MDASSWSWVYSLGSGATPEQAVISAAVPVTMASVTAALLVKAQRVLCVLFMEFLGSLFVVCVCLFFQPPVQ